MGERTGPAGALPEERPRTPGAVSPGCLPLPSSGPATGRKLPATPGREQPAEGGAAAPGHPRGAGSPPHWPFGNPDTRCKNPIFNLTRTWFFLHQITEKYRPTRSGSLFKTMMSLNFRNRHNILALTHSLVSKAFSVAGASRGHTVRHTIGLSSPQRVGHMALPARVPWGPPGAPCPRGRPSGQGHGPGRPPPRFSKPSRPEAPRATWSAGQRARQWSGPHDHIPS